MGKTELKLEIDADLLAQAEAANVPLEAVLEAGLRLALANRVEAPAEDRARRWAEENVEALRDHNQRIAEHGVFGEDFRTW